MPLLAQAWFDVEFGPAQRFACAFRPAADFVLEVPEADDHPKPVLGGGRMRHALIGAGLAVVFVLAVALLALVLSRISRMTRRSGDAVA